MSLVVKGLVSVYSENLDHISELAELALPPPHVVRVRKGDRGRGGTLVL